MAEIPSQTPELETESASTSTPNVRKSSRKPVAKKLNVDPYEQYSHKWTVADKTTLLKALKEFGPTDIDNISSKLPNKHPNQIKVFINNMKSKARIITEYKTQRGLKNKMSHLKQIIKFIEKNESGKIDDWFNPSLSIAMAIIKNMEEHPPATEGIGIDYKEAYEYLEHILEFRGGNINNDMQPVENMLDIAPCEGKCDGHSHKWKMPDRAAMLRVLDELAPIDSETQTSLKTKEAVNINEESNNKAQSTENVNVLIADKTQTSEKTEEAVNVNEESNNTSQSAENVDVLIADKTQISEKTEEAVNVIEESNNTAQSAENVNVLIADKTQISEKTDEAVNVNEESNNKAKSTENVNVPIADAENAADGKYVKIRQRAKEIVKKQKDAVECARKNMADDKEEFSRRTKNFVHQSIYTVLKSSVINFDELNAIIYQKTNETNEIPGMYEFNPDNPILTAQKDKDEAMLKSYLNNNIHNPLSLSRGTVTAPPKLLSHFLKYNKS